MISITKSALIKLQSFLSDEPKGTFFRIAVVGGGCSGYSYKMTFEEQMGDDDNLIPNLEVPIVIDGQSMPLISGSVVDYSDSLQGAGFQIKNPSATKTCGCGSSFST